jgi:DNA-nicking Smr family endonuclease
MFTVDVLEFSDDEEQKKSQEIQDKMEMFKKHQEVENVKSQPFKEIKVKEEINETKEVQEEHLEEFTTLKEYNEGRILEDCLRYPYVPVKKRIFKRVYKGETKKFIIDCTD